MKTTVKTATLPTPEPLALPVDPEEVVRQERVLVDPEQAQKWLATNTHNRPIVTRVVQRYSQDMLAGEWRYNPMEPLGFRKDGTCCQGQHRLAALVMSNTSQWFDILYNVPEHLFSVIDTGRTRSGSDTLAMVGELNRFVLASALRWLRLDEHARSRVARGVEYRMHRNIHVSNQEILQMLDKHPKIRDSVRWAQCIKPHTLIPGALAVWVHYRAYQIDSDRADAYFADLSTGSGLTEGDPALAVRNWFTGNLASKRKATLEHCAAILIKGWNKMCQGDSWKNAIWKTTVEEFPRMWGEKW